MIITTKARNLRYGWTNTPGEDPEPMVRGGLRSIERERSEAVRGNNGNEWKEVLWVGDKKIATTHDHVKFIIWNLRAYGDYKIGGYGAAWLEPAEVFNPRTGRWE